jgi:hypothetical protein
MEKDITDKEMEPSMNNISEDSEDSEIEMEPEMKTEKGKRGKESLNQLSIHLGDILRISSPGNLKYHEKTFLVDYCGVKIMIWIDVESGVSYELKLVGKGHEEFEEKEGIISIELLSREKYPGYAKQNGLEVGIWVDVEFGGEVPFLVSGMISNLEEDQIEITTWPNQEIFYLDFQYEGSWNIEPKIEKIQIRDAPSLEAEKVMAELLESNRVRNGELEDLLDAELEEREGLETMLENEEAESNRLERLREEYVQGTAFAKSIIPEIEYGEVLGNYYQRVEQRKEDIRYSLNAQLEDFMNELLSTLPNYMRTPQVMQEVEHTLERFRELHGMFARMNDSGAVTGYRSNRYLGKPLVSSLVDFSVDGGSGDSGAVGGGKWIRNTGWVIPVVYLRKKGWHDVIAGEVESVNSLNNDVNGYFNAREEFYDDGKGGEEWIQNPACVWLKGMQEAMEKWVSDSGRGGYRKLLQELDVAMSPVMQFSKEQILAAGIMGGRGENGSGEEEGWNMVGPYEAGVPLEMVVDNTAFRNEGVFGNAENDGFYSTVAQVGNGDLPTRRHAGLGHWEPTCRCCPLPPPFSWPHGWRAAPRWRGIRLRRACPRDRSPISCPARLRAATRSTTGSGIGRAATSKMASARTGCRSSRPGVPRGGGWPTTPAESAPTAAASTMSRPSSTTVPPTTEPPGCTRTGVASPVIAVSLRTLRPVSSEVSAVNMVTPALGPSLGTAPAGTWMCTSCDARNSGSTPSSGACERT